MASVDAVVDAVVVESRVVPHVRRALVREESTRRRRTAMTTETCSPRQPSFGGRDEDDEGDGKTLDRYAHTT